MAKNVSIFAYLVSPISLSLLPSQGSPPQHPQPMQPVVTLGASQKGRMSNPVLHSSGFHVLLHLTS